MCGEAAAKRLHEVADDLASTNDIVLERGGARYLVKGPRRGDAEG
jgi:hypothetical protein